MAAGCVSVYMAAHRITRPLRQFAQAADRFGVDVRAPPMPYTVPENYAGRPVPSTACTNAYAALLTTAP